MYTLIKKIAVSFIAVSLTFGTQAEVPNAIDEAMYFRSQVNDAPVCKDMKVMGGEILFPEAVTNPAITCPDAFAWKKLIETIQSEFWKNWAYDAYTYPKEPYALCSDTSDKKCCSIPDETSYNNNPGYTNKSNPANHCPYYPGDHPDSLGHTFAQLAFKRHTNSFYTNDNTTGTEKIDPGRVIRQEVAEVVYRNRPMWSYNFKNNLYNQNGLGQVFNKIKYSIEKNAPYRPNGIAIDFPVGSIMFKTDWLHVDRAKDMKIYNDPKHPYITMNIEKIGDNDSGRYKSGLHYLMAITAASKDIPNWHWYAIEHVNNPGRCDYTGCNDSFGYTSADKIPEKYKKNYTRPKTKSDGLTTSSPIFDTGKVYPPEKITTELQNIFTHLGIGTNKTNSTQISKKNKAWLSYRLKGVQTEFTTKEGVDTVMGNSITEGGFVNTSSCMTCHSQAAVNSKGVAAINSIGSSNQLNLLGYKQSTNGAPENSWFYVQGTSKPLNIQTDFVWGILFAKPIAIPIIPIKSE